MITNKYEVTNKYTNNNELIRNNSCSNSLFRMSGFTALELIIVVSTIFIMSAIVLNAFINYRKTQALSKDTETVVEILRLARGQTLSSQNASQYGVHFASSTITLFVGSSYVVGTTTNKDFNLISADTILTLALTGGGNNVIFNRLTGETSQDGIIVISSSLATTTKTVTIYKTGLIESQ